MACFRRAAERVARQLDDNEKGQERGQKDQDGSKIRSAKLARLPPRFRLARSRLRRDYADVSREDFLASPHIALVALAG
jgi:hypothetical protein